MLSLSSLLTRLTREEEIVTKDKTHRRSRARRFMLFGGLPLLAAGLFFVPRALAFGPWHGRHGAHTSEDVREHMLRRADFILDRLDATDEQRDKVDAIVDKAAPELFKLAKAGKNVRQQIQTALAAPAIDKAAVDKARVELDALASQATELGMNTLVAMAEVLTPAQRKKVAEHFDSHHR